MVFASVTPANVVVGGTARELVPGVDDRNEVAAGVGDVTWLLPGSSIRAVGF